MEWETRPTLLEKLARFDEATAWQRLDDQFREPILGLARKMGLDRQQAEDAVQDAWTRFSEAYRDGRYDPAKGRLRDWLFAIATNSIRSARRKTRARSDRELPVQDSVLVNQAVEGDDLESSWNQEWQRARYRHALKQLAREVTPKSMQVLLLLTRDRLGPKQVAARLQTSLDSVYNVRSRLVKRLRVLCRGFDECGA